MMPRFLLFAFFLTASVVAGEPTAVIVAHRGASHDAPENTLAAFKLAWEQGADAIEGDFFLTKDKQIVCTHDRTTERLNKRKLKLDVAKSTLDELRTLDVGSWKGDEWEGERMPILTDVLKTVPSGKKIYVEVKCGAEIVPFLKESIDSSRLRPEQVVIISFKKAVVLKAKIAMPEIKAFWLASFKQDKKTGAVEPTTESVKEVLKMVRADGFSCGDHGLLSLKLLEAVRAAGCETHCWTVDDPKRAKELVAMGMQSITTNRPALIRKALAEE